MALANAGNCLKVRAGERDLGRDLGTPLRVARGALAVKTHTRSTKTMMRFIKKIQLQLSEHKQGRQRISCCGKCLPPGLDTAHTTADKASSDQRGGIVPLFDIGHNLEYTCSSRRDVERRRPVG